MMPTVAALLEVLKAAPLRGLSGGCNAWQLDGVDRETEGLRLRLLDTAARFPTVYVHYDAEHPNEPTLKNATHVSNGVWRVPVGASGEDLSSWLYLGNWQMYARAEPLETVRDLCRTDRAGLSRFVLEAEVAFVIDSFHDDTQWTIGLWAACE